jgi:hypothetical protein
MEAEVEHRNGHGRVQKQGGQFALVGPERPKTLDAWDFIKLRKAQCSAHARGVAQCVEKGSLSHGVKAAPHREAFVL